MNEANKDFEEFIKGQGMELESRLIEIKLPKMLWRVFDFMALTTHMSVIGYESIDDLINRIVRNDLNGLFGELSKRPELYNMLKYVTTCSDEDFGIAVEHAKFKIDNM